MPPGCAAAVFLYGSSLSQGNVGRRSETADTEIRLTFWYSKRLGPVRRRSWGDRAVRDRGGADAGRLAAYGLLALRRQRGDDGVVALDQPQLAGTARRAEFVEELDIGLVVVLPLLRHVVLVEDRLDRADRLTGTTVDAF